MVFWVKEKLRSFFSYQVHKLQIRYFARTATTPITKSSFNSNLALSPIRLRVHAKSSHLRSYLLSRDHAKSNLSSYRCCYFRIGSRPAHSFVFLTQLEAYRRYFVVASTLNLLQLIWHHHHTYRFHHRQHCSMFA